MIAKAKVKVYTRKQRKGNGRVYYFQQAVAVIQARTASVKLDELDGKEVYIGTEEDAILAEAGRVLIKFFIQLPGDVLSKFQVSDEEKEILEKALKIVFGGEE